MSKMALHEPFGHLQPKLWAKEGPGVKLAVWLPTTKSRESTRPRHLQQKCDMALEISRGKLQLWFKPRGPSSFNFPQLNLLDPQVGLARVLRGASIISHKRKIHPRWIEKKCNENHSIYSKKRHYHWRQGPWRTEMVNRSWCRMPHIYKVPST
jgi:hypothetical protein